MVLGGSGAGSLLSSPPLLITGPCRRQTCRGALAGGADSHESSLRGPTPQAGANHLLEASPHLTNRRPLVPLRDIVPRPASSPRAAAPPGAWTSCGRPPPLHTDQQRFPPHVRSPAHPAKDLLSPHSWELPGFTALNSHLDTPNLKFVRIYPSESLKHMSHASSVDWPASSPPAWALTARANPQPTTVTDILVLGLKEEEKREWQGASLVVQWLRPCAPNAGGPGLIPAQGSGSRMPQLRPTRHSQINKRQSTNPASITQLTSTWHPHSIDETMELLITRSLPPRLDSIPGEELLRRTFSLMTLRMRLAIDTENLAVCLARRR
ncbi:uncharacterized protein LOC121820546 [Ovis aries]|uniref:uncharacterized protein LOC121820546 n=1 Tax=Ovis aries TaxID=9940 RepID=UPI001C2EC05D|nr:uncharacterized protein LOC121820546 [Ovis aries]XP_042111305.1 uncharacterized protein LOC121820546 [Ovis aries]XP_042111306.1 uncharacterized protein LOC121820546 [Ovis aries]XP_060251171.1 uncharacterized protein LOC121820546 [Ovis aries]XP_060251172.1 uncharacterized protein LOC121820546 [Ovis aries]XP_060251173.1 uncharacterized protein LOC121820546 [Ovis aries]XP_060251174.1 uncharacterized protein LOC121820546 [Ovis aries]